MSMKYFLYFFLSLFLLTFLVAAPTVYAESGNEDDHHMEDYISDEEKDAIVDGLKGEYLHEDNIDLESYESLHEHAAELNEKVDFPGESEAKKEESKTVYKYNKELPKSMDEKIPRLWVVPKR